MGMMAITTSRTEEARVDLEHAEPVCEGFEGMMEELRGKLRVRVG